MKEREFITLLDVRSSQAYNASSQRIHGDLRINPDDLHILPRLPKDQLTVAYCT
jgi:hypothetical protein